MAFRSGIGGQLGFKIETEYGKYVKPTKFLEIESESLAIQKNYIETYLIASDQSFLPKGGHRGVTQIVGGTINFPLFDKGGLGSFFNLLHGETVTAEKIEAGKAYKQVHKIGFSKPEPFSKSLTIQVGRPEVTEGKIKPFNFLGCKIPAMSISIDQGDIAKVALTILGRKGETTEAIETASYTAGALPFTFQQVEVKAKGTKLAEAQSATVNFAIPQPERYRLGNEGLTSEPILNAASEATLSTTLDFTSLTSHERYLSEETVEVLVKYEGSNIDEAKNPRKVEILFPAAKQVTSAPALAGPDIVSEDVEFKALDDGSNPPVTVTIVSEDTALG